MSKMLNICFLIVLILCITSGMMTKNFKTSANSQRGSPHKLSSGNGCIRDSSCASGSCRSNTCA